MLLVKERASVIRGRRTASLAIIAQPFGFQIKKKKKHSSRSLCCPPGTLSSAQQNHIKGFKRTLAAIQGPLTPYKRKLHVETFINGSIFHDLLQLKLHLWVLENFVPLWRFHDSSSSTSDSQLRDLFKDLLSHQRQSTLPLLDLFMDLRALNLNSPQRQKILCDRLLAF